jgi:hypothetical protein
MRRISAVALLVGLGMALPVYAQRGGGARVAVARPSLGGFSGGGFRAGIAPASRYSYASATPLLTGRLPVPALRTPKPVYYGQRNYGANPPRREIPAPRVAVGGAFVSYLPFYGFAGGYAGGDAQDNGDMSAGSVALAPPVVDQGYQEYPGGYGPYDAPPPSPLLALGPPATAAPVAEPEAEDAVTLVFKDGRPQEQIHNYMLTRTKLYVQDGRRREISVEDLDLVAMAKVNKAAGVDFRLPVTGK